jgi:pimeloyl-ACP methyl ester carboxylesterase
VLEIELEDIVVRSGDVDLHVVAGGPPGAPLVILLHGFPEFWYGWRGQIGPLIEAGFRVVAPDQRGYGTSGKPKGIAPYSLGHLAADVLRIADYFRAKEFDLVGHDFGGIVAWWAAVKYPRRIRRLVVINAPHPIAARRYVRWHWTQPFRSWYVFFFQLPHLPELFLAWRDFALLRFAMKHSAATGTFTDEEFSQYREAWSQPGALKAMLAWYRTFRRFRARRGDLTVRRPTLILWGDRDVFLSYGLARASLEFCSDARVSRVQGASHWLQHEGPELLAEEIIGFLRGE